MTDYTSEQTAKIVPAAINALKLLDAVYAWTDRVEKAGGATSIGGVAECHAMLASLKKQRPRVEQLVAEPLRAALYPATEGVDQ